MEIVTVVKKENKWVVMDGGIAFDSFNTKEEADEQAKLLEKAKQVVADIETYADQVINRLTPKERTFLREYAGNIEIEI